MSVFNNHASGCRCHKLGSELFSVPLHRLPSSALWFWQARSSGLQVFLRTPVLFIDPGCDHGRGERAEEDAAHDAWRNVHKLAQDQLDTDEYQDCCHPILEELEELDKLVDDEEHGPKTKHRKDG